MRVFVNDLAVDLLPGMSVRHALMSSGLLGEVSPARRIYDEWGNELGLDGELKDGMKIYVR